MSDQTEQNIITLLQTKNLIEGDKWSASGLGGDGSARTFIRLTKKGKSAVAVLPSGNAEDASGKQGISEARSAYLIGRHLFSRGVPVPEIYGYDEETGILIFEDLGDTLLHHETGPEANEKKIHARYQHAMRILVHMQFAGANGFDPAWCWQTPRYDRQLMLEKESTYFLQSFCSDYLGIHSFSADLHRELENLADRCTLEPPDFFLHRDFQSRNLMIHADTIRVIDFQGGRMGPLGYDLASLLLDPYAGLSHSLQEELLAYYISSATPLGIIGENFPTGFARLALQRNLQILGAFAFLFKVQGKVFFQQFIEPALQSLHERLAKPLFDDYPCLRKLAGECRRLFH
jgi:aminoglycoside/choline kinase family phosphotransferase